MVDAFQLWLNIPESKAAQIKRIVGSLHDASLLIDDIEDNSEMRRGLPSTTVKVGWGKAMSDEDMASGDATEATRVSRFSEWRRQRELIRLV